MKTVVAILTALLAGCAALEFHATYDGVLVDAEVRKEARQ